MTRIASYTLNIAPCCGAIYSTPRYRSMNFLAWEYWTDGYKEGALLPSGNGLRKCKCGNFFMLTELHEITRIDGTEAPSPKRVASEELPEAIAKARTPIIEQAARQEYWVHLNHPYRERYITHREAEEASTKAAWEADNPDTRNWWQRFRKVPSPRYPAHQSSHFTCPPFEPDHQQRENMAALIDLIQNQDQPDRVILAELNRELGNFGAAGCELKLLSDGDRSSASRLISELVDEKQSAPIRFQM
jgi:hypothetical protein